MFDPNNISTKSNRKLNYTHDWATYIPNRSTKFKIHGTKGQAIAAIRYRYHYVWMQDGLGGPVYILEDDVQLFQLVNGKWVDIPLVQKYNGRTSLKSPILAENT